MVYDFILYQGSNNDLQKVSGIGGSIVLQLDNDEEIFPSN